MAVKLLLREDVGGLGITGDTVSVAEGYARNFLLPRNLAVALTPANLASLEKEKKRRAARELERLQDFKAMAERIQACDITLKERVSEGDNLYGAIQAKEVCAALADESINLDAEMVKMDEPIKTLGVHRVKIRLHPQVEAELKVWVVELKEVDASGSASGSASS